MPRIAVLLVLAVAFIAPEATAQLPDHLKCYKINDPQTKTTYTADLGGLAPEPGCVVKVPAKLLCVQTTKTHVEPPAPINGSGESPAAGAFLCYTVKCSKHRVSPFAVMDQFGQRSVTPKAASLLCAPLLGTTTTTATTMTTASSTPPTTVLVCEGQTCNGPCPAGTACTPHELALGGENAGCACEPCGSLNAPACGGTCSPIVGPGGGTYFTRCIAQNNACVCREVCDRRPSGCFGFCSGGQCTDDGNGNCVCQ